jgi:uncharacterized protein YdhG (YjbR/CyaY superfamily)
LIVRDYSGFVTARKKMKKTNFKTVDEYLAAVPEPGRSTLNKLRGMIRSMVPREAAETISYQMPAFRYKGALVCYGAFSDHCSFFPMDASLIVKFRKELKRYSTAKGTVRFPLDQPPPKALLKKIVKARVARNEEKAARKTQRG